jgi:putative heme iron utilization protein
MLTNIVNWCYPSITTLKGVVKVKKKEPFQKLNIDIEAHRENEKVQNEVSQAVDAMMEKVDSEVDKALIDLLKELGYDAKDGMTLEEAQELYKKMEEAGQFIDVDTHQEGNTYIVELKVVQLARTLKFDLG